MSRTLHHRKPGTPRTPAKRPIPRAHHDAPFTRAVRSGDWEDLPTFEPSANRRTR